MTGELTQRQAYEKECREHFNEIGLFGDTDICRLVGFSDDGDDFYWIVMRPDFRGEYKKIYCSMVGPWISLKNIYPRYENLEHQFTHVWQCPPQKDFLLDVVEE